MNTRVFFMARQQHRRLWAWLPLCLVLMTGCSIKKMAINKMGDALSASGTTFASDDDPELIKAAVPFSLKLIESLLAESPRHKGLLLAACSGFTQYSFAFVNQEADEMEDTDLAASDVLRARSKRLYLRARNYGLRSLEVNHTDFAKQLRSDPKAAARSMRVSDVPLLYWTAAAWGAAISISKDDPALVSDQLIVEALIDRALELDEDFARGSIHVFLISYEMARQGARGDPAARARKHFDRAMELSKGTLASPLLSLAESVALQNQDREEFVTLLNRALAVDPDATPESRLENLITQRRARWQLGRIDELFLDGAKDDSK